MLKYQFLRKKYPRFVYESYSWRTSEEDLEISFDFKIESPEECPPYIYFKPKVIIKNINKKRIERVGEGILDNLVFNLGLIELLSYWKATCSPEIIIKAGHLNEEQIKWWKNLIFNGMGQFFYENKIDFTTPLFLEFISSGSDPELLQKYKEKKLKDRVLVPIGGGKDSVVTLELLKKMKKRMKCFSLSPTDAARKIMKIGNYRNPVIVERTIDPKLFELNRKGFLNGHTPFSAYLAFLSVLCAVISDYKYIAFSNERSSNEGNVRYLGKVINHQYSKSFDFEERFRKYQKEYLVKGVEYFSFLRPLYEIQIAKLFSKYPRYFNAFLSCNEAYKTKSGARKPLKKWCGDCPKCLFIFASLYPFIGERIVRIFGPARIATLARRRCIAASEQSVAGGPARNASPARQPEGSHGGGHSDAGGKNLFKDRKLLPLMLELIGKRKFKPFECIGTKKESLVAFYLSWKKYRDRVSVKLPFLLKYFEKNVLPKYPNLEKEAKDILNSWDNQHNLSEELGKILKTATSY